MVDVSLYSLRYINFVKLSTITNMLLYNIPMRGSSNSGSLVMKSRVTIDHSYLGVGAD